MSDKKQDSISLAAVQALCLKRNIPFFSYRLPGSPELHFGAQTDGNPETFRGFADTRREDGFLFSPFDTQEKLPALFIRNDLSFTGRLENHTDWLRLQAIHRPDRPAGQRESDCSRQEYNRQVSAFISALKQGSLKKAVLSRTITVNGNAREEAPVLFEKMVRQYPDAFVFLVSIPGTAVWTGATPEIFLHQSPSAVTAMSLAGTQPASQEPEAVSWPYKDREEQQIVSDYIRHVFSSVCAGQVQCSGPATYRAGNVYHLCSIFKAPVLLSGLQADRLITGLHPTPAVGGFPKEKALQLIKETENHDRRYYAGYLGPVHENGTFSLFVNLRSMELFPDAFRLYVGGGITALSDPETEWRETEIKSQTMLNLIYNQ